MVLALRNRGAPGGGDGGLDLFIREAGQAAGVLGWQKRTAERYRARLWGRRDSHSSFSSCSGNGYLEQVFGGERLAREGGSGEADRFVRIGARLEVDQDQLLDPGFGGDAAGVLGGRVVVLE